DNGSFLDSYLSEEKYSYRYNDQLKGQALGFQGGLGLEISLSSRLAFMVEAVYRQANFKNWKGSGQENLIYLERYGSESTGYTQNTENESQSYCGQLVFINYSDGPSILGLGNSSEPDSRRAVIKLSGPVFKAGVKLRF
ncbi:MAG: hypothetical protein ACPLRA_02365, partial [Candidatus Saccharicenans sp.]